MFSVNRKGLLPEVSPIDETPGFYTSQNVSTGINDTESSAAGEGQIESEDEEILSQPRQKNGQDLDKSGDNLSVTDAKPSATFNEERLIGIVSKMNETINTLNVKLNGIDARIGTGSAVGGGNVIHNPTVEDRFPIDSVENFMAFEEILKKDQSLFNYLVSQHPIQVTFNLFTLLIHQLL